MTHDRYARAARLASPALLMPILATAQTTQQSGTWDCAGPWHGHMWGGGWGFWWVMPLFMVFMFIGFLVLMSRHSGPRHFGVGHADSALQLLNERFARGEIQLAEYEEKKAALLRRS